VLFGRARGARLQVLERGGSGSGEAPVTTIPRLSARAERSGSGGCCHELSAPPHGVAWTRSETILSHAPQGVLGTLHLGARRILLAEESRVVQRDRGVAGQGAARAQILWCTGASPGALKYGEQPEGLVAEHERHEQAARVAVAQKRQSQGVGAEIVVVHECHGLLPVLLGLVFGDLTRAAAQDTRDTLGDLDQKLVEVELTGCTLRYVPAPCERACAASRH